MFVGEQKTQQLKENDRCAKPRICKSMHLVAVIVMPSFNEVYLREHSYRHGGSRLRDVRPSLNCEGWHACKTSKIKQQLCKYTGKQAWAGSGVNKTHETHVEESNLREQHLAKLLTRLTLDSNLFTSTNAWWTGCSPLRIHHKHEQTQAAGVGPE